MSETFDKQLDFISKPDVPTYNENDTTGASVNVIANADAHMYWDEINNYFLSLFYHHAIDGYEMALWDLLNEYTDEDNLVVDLSVLIDVSNENFDYRANFGLFKDGDEPWKNSIVISLRYDGPTAYWQARIYTTGTSPVLAISIEDDSFDAPDQWAMRRVVLRWNKETRKVTMDVYKIDNGLKLYPDEDAIIEKIGRVVSEELAGGNTFTVDRIGMSTDYWKSANDSNTSYIEAHVFNLSGIYIDSASARMIGNLPPFIRSD